MILGDFVLVCVCVCVCACLFDVRENTILVYLSLLLSSFIYSALTLSLSLFWQVCVQNGSSLSYRYIRGREGGREGEEKEKEERCSVIYIFYP